MTEPPLPGILADIAAVAGREAAIDTAAAFGGLTMHIPAPENVNGHELGRVLGEERALLISLHFKGEQIYIPMARRHVIRRMHSHGAGKREIARRLAVSYRTVHRLLK
ncbi:MAG: helix-turn-helix domain-containing protein [Rhodobacteraceae bacterium]|nr:helix-turn-helix domain-containing protein [Paracoccaceae bacterium]